MTKRGDLNKVLEGIFAAKRAGLAPIKLNAVVERGSRRRHHSARRIFPRTRLCHAFYRVHGCRQLQQLDLGKAGAEKEIIENIHARYRSEKSVVIRVAHRRSIRICRRRGDIGVIASVTEPFSVAARDCVSRRTARLSPACSHSWVMTSKV